MPYTPPSQLSPSVNETESTSGNGDTGFQSPSDRKVLESQLPSSTQHPPTHSNHHAFTSTSYFRRHRRSPTIGKSFGLPSGSLPRTNLPQQQLKHHVVDPRASIQQSPPPVNDALIPTGAIISPPESAYNSSDEEEETMKSKDGNVMAELQAAIQSLDQPRSNSKSDKVGLQSVREMPLALPDRSKAEDNKSEANLRKPASLSEGARKISHSRSTSETSPLRHQSASPDSSPEESDQGSSEEIELTSRPPMVRKKSGELVRPALRPSSRKRPSSMPGTPTFSKAVHFDSHLEHIRHFLQLDKPLAVSAGSSPVEDFADNAEFPFQKSSSELEIRLPNFPQDQEARKHNIVRVERLFMSSDKKKLVGSVAVANLAYQKHVVARFTLDYWKTTSEVVAEYNHDVRKKLAHDGYDRFYFNIELSDQVNLESKVMFLCIRYNTNGQEFWDNNSSMNYQVGFSKKEMSEDSGSASKLRSLQPLGQSLPRSRGSVGGNKVRPKSMPPSHDDFISGFNNSNFPDVSMDKESKNSELSMSPPRSDDIVPDAPTRRSKPTPNAFGTRYNFGASLSAAMQPGSAQERNNKAARDTPKPRAATSGMARERKTQRPTPPEISPSEPKPAALVSEKPHHQSAVYKELVDKYCFFETKPSPQPSKLSSQLQQSGDNPTSAQEIARTGDGASDSYSPSPSPPQLSSSPVKLSGTPSSLPASPTPATGSTFGPHQASPIPFSHPCHDLMHNGFFSEPHSPATTILG